MRLAFDSRRLIGRARGVNGWTLLELALLALIALQCARLIWIAVTPVGPLGDWRGTGRAPVADRADRSDGGPDQARALQRDQSEQGELEQRPAVDAPGAADQPPAVKR